MEYTIGPPGPIGPEGLDGLQGETGDQGPIGLTGSQGIQGIQGIQGQQGQDGSIVNFENDFNSYLDFNAPVNKGTWTPFGSDIQYSGNETIIRNNGNTILITDPYANNNKGLVRVYDNINSSWTQRGTDVSGITTSELDNEKYGSNVSLSLDGNEIFIVHDEWTDYNNSDGLSYACVYTWNKQSSSWDKKGNNITEKFIYSSKMSGDGKTICITKRSSSFDGIYIYKFINDDWSLISNPAGTGDLFRLNISDDGNRVIIIRRTGGDPNEGEPTEEVKVYEYNEELGTYNIIGQVFQGTLYLGINISGDGTTIAYQDYTTSTGIVKIFKYISTQWIQVGTDISGLDPPEDDNRFGQFKIELSTNGNTIVAGSRRGDNANGENSGEILIYTFNGTYWNQIGETIIGDGAYQYWGFLYLISISGDGKHIAFGSQPSDNNRIRTYELTNYVMDFKNSRLTQNNVAIGKNAGVIGQGNNSIAIGAFSGQTNQPSNSIILNSSGIEIQGIQNGFIVNKIRKFTNSNGFYALYYNPVTHEVAYYYPYLTFDVAGGGALIEEDYINKFIIPTASESWAYYANTNTSISTFPLYFTNGATISFQAKAPINTNINFKFLQQDTTTFPTLTTKIITITTTEYSNYNLVIENIADLISGNDNFPNNNIIFNGDNPIGDIPTNQTFYIILFKIQERNQSVFIRNILVTPN